MSSEGHPNLKLTIEQCRMFMEYIQITRSEIMEAWLAKYVQLKRLNKGYIVYKVCFQFL